MENVPIIWYNIFMNASILKQLFWDVDEASFSLLSEKHIIQRALTYGTLSVIRAIFNTYRKKSIRKVFLNMKDGALTPRRRSLFAIILA